MNPHGQQNDSSRCPYAHRQTWLGTYWEDCRTCKRGHSDPLATEFNAGIAVSFGILALATWARRVSAKATNR